MADKEIYYHVPQGDDESISDYEWRVLSHTVITYVRALYEQCAECERIGECILAPKCSVVLVIKRPEITGAYFAWAVSGFLSAKI